MEGTEPQQMIETAAAGLSLVDILMIGGGFASLVGWFTRLEVRSKANETRLNETKETIKLIFKKIDKLSGSDSGDRRTGPRD